MQSEQLERLVVERDDALPPLAWLLTVTGKTPRLDCGANVETASAGARHGFFEGCWGGDFAAFAFDAARDVFGSGGFVEGARVVLVSPSHPLEPLFLLTLKDRVLASNSLPFLIARGGLDVRRMRDLHVRHNSILKGLRTFERTLFETDEVRLDAHVREIVELTEGRVSVRPTPHEDPLESFAHYRARLKEGMAAAAANASDPRRRRRYALLTTLTSGFDSPAIAGLAKELGCNEAVSVGSGRYDLDDSGTPAAAALGMDCIVKPRPTAASATLRTDAEFLASFCPGDRFFAVFDGMLAGRAILTGHHGGAQWDVVGPDDPPFERIGGGSGMGFREFRLRNDFLLIPVPMMGAERLADIRRITRSEEMAPFRTGGAYDRPIPRRLGREAGIPDAAYGQRKAVASQAFWEWGFAPDTVAASDSFVRPMMSPRQRLREAAIRAGSKTLAWSVRPPADPARRTALHRLRTHLGRHASGRTVHLTNVRLYRDLMTLWALDEVAKRYRAPGEAAARAGPIDLEGAA